MLEKFRSPMSISQNLREIDVRAEKIWGIFERYQTNLFKSNF
jgi:hypothetical protein